MPRVDLIADATTNHGGDLNLVSDFIDAAHYAGCDWIKFQLTRARHLAADDPQLAWFAQAEMTDYQWEVAKAMADVVGIPLLFTVFHPAEVPLVKALGCTAIKVGSGEADEAKLALAINAAGFERIFVSCGITAQPHYYSAENTTFLRCVSRYPHPDFTHAPYGQRPGDTGWSDHAVGLDCAYKAVLAGATTIEKHLRIDGQAREPKPWEATPMEFQSLRAFADDDPTRFVGRWQHGD